MTEKTTSFPREELSMQIGDRLREARRQRHLSLQQVAQSAGISAATLSRIETSKQSLDIRLLLRVAETLGASPADFLARGNEDRVADVQRALERLAPEMRSALWTTLAARANNGGTYPPEPIANRLSELLAQLDLLRAEVESMKREIEKGR
jgi:transcriptional regulator with XRE-family HTH domain